MRGAAVPTGVDVSLAGATVTLGNRQANVSPAGTFSLEDVEPGKQHIVVEKTFSSGKTLRVLGISTIFVADTPVDVKIPVRDATDLDAYCLGCHPSLGKAVRRDQKVRDAHPSGVVAQKAVGDPTLLDSNGRITCESCHTAHRASQYPLFGRGDIRQGPFCNRCHSSR